MNIKDIPNDCILSDSEAGKLLGFTADKFQGWLWRQDQYIVISFILSIQEGKGHLKKLFDQINECGFKIQVPVPSERMKAICAKRGMKMQQVYSKEFQENIETIIQL